MYLVTFYGDDGRPRTQERSTWTSIMELVDKVCRSPKAYPVIVCNQAGDIIQQINNR